MAAALAGCAGVGDPRPGAPSHHRERGFANTNPEFTRPSGWTRAKFFAIHAIPKMLYRRSIELPRAEREGRLPETPAAPALTWIGHATLLVQLDGVNLLTDPHFAERASPFNWVGPRRLNPPGVRFEDLPPIHAVVISHSHYDHLDETTVRRLAERHRPLFLVPLGLKRWFAGLGITNVEELDWWAERRVGALTLTSVPVQHWSSRSPWDTNETLWSGWALAGTRRLFFAGDTGYYDGFKEVGARLGPFDVAAIAIGAYDPPEMMRMTHTTPEEALRISADVRATRFVAIHWGTFDLGTEPLDEPPRRLGAEARRLGLGPDRVWILQHGETRAF